MSAMERGEESRLTRVPSSDRVSARVRRSRPVGPPPIVNIFDVRQPLSTDGGATGTPWGTTAVKPPTPCVRRGV